MVTHTDGTVFVEEVKPTSQHHYEENQQKWQAAIAHFSAIGIGFRIVTEHTVGGEKAIRGFRTEGLQTIDDTERKKRKKEVYSAYRARNIDRITQKQKIREAKYKNDAEYYSAMLHKRKMAKRAKKQKEKEELCKSNLSFIF
jgi:Asp-tRNA(Asn)/Glu-tRNA(Gln) amidotransferase A subunit family amidase